MTTTDESYYPSAKVSLVVRFEEFGDKSVASTGRQTNPRPPIRHSGIKAPNPPLTPGTDPNAPQGVTRILLNPNSGGKGTPQDQSASADNYTHAVGGIIPSKASWSVNGPRTADTLSVTLRWIDLPVDPRTVRSCGIVFFLGTLTAEEFARGMGGEKRGDFSGAGEPLNVIPETYLDDNGNQRTNKRFVGWVDKWSVSWDADSEPTVKLECRDNTTTLIDHDAPVKLVVDMNIPLDKAIAQYLANFPQYAGMSVEYRPSTETPPVMKDVLSKTAFRPTLGPQPSKAGGAASGGGAAAKLSIWDYLTDICGSMGLMIRLEDTNLIIQHVRSYMTASYAQQAGQPLNNARPDDPFQSRRLDGRDTIYTRRMIYGHNLLNYSVDRSFAKVAPINIEVRCYVPGRKNVMVSHFPASTDKVQDKKPGDQPAEEKWEVHRVSGVKDQATLDRIAQAYYEMHARRELEVKLKTTHLTSFGGSNSDPDLLDMRAGDSLEVLVKRDSGSETNTMTNIEASLLMQPRAQSFMEKLGHGAKYAAAYAKAYTDAGFQTVYRLKSMTVNWAVEEGVSFELNLFNYVEVRLDLPALGGK